MRVAFLGEFLYAAAQAETDLGAGAVQQVVARGAAADAGEQRRRRMLRVWRSLGGWRLATAQVSCWGGCLVLGGAGCFRAASSGRHGAGRAPRGGDQKRESTGRRPSAKRARWGMRWNQRQQERGGGVMRGRREVGTGGPLWLVFPQPFQRRLGARQQPKAPPQARAYHTANLKGGEGGGVACPITHTNNKPKLHPPQKTLPRPLLLPPLPRQRAMDIFEHVRRWLGHGSGQCGHAVSCCARMTAASSRRREFDSGCWVAVGGWRLQTVRHRERRQRRLPVPGLAEAPRVLGSASARLMPPNLRGPISCPPPSSWAFQRATSPLTHPGPSPHPPLLSAPAVQRRYPGGADHSTGARQRVAVGVCRGKGAAPR